MSSPWLSGALLTAGMNPIAAIGAYRRVYCVDPINGNDANAGTSWSAPFLTAQQAVTQFIEDKHNDYTGSALAPTAEIYGMNGLILLGAGDYAPPDNVTPIIEIPTWTADGATTGGGWGLTIMGVSWNGRALLEGGATNTVPLILAAGAHGVRILNLHFHRQLKTAGIPDILLTDGDEGILYPGGAAAHHPNYFQIAGCHFLEDMIADGESSEMAIHIKSGQHGIINGNYFYSRSSPGANPARGIVLQNDNGNPGRIVIAYNEFEALEDCAIRYLAAASIQGLNIYNNIFRKNGSTIAGPAFAMANAIDIPNGKAAEYQPIINDNRFMTWAALDNAAATDAIYDAQGAAVVDAGTDYYGNDNTNLLSS